MALNRWRENSNLPLHPLPESAYIEPVQEEDLRRLFTRVVEGDDQDSEAAISEIEAKGLGAYPFVAARLKELEPTDAAYASLHSLARRLANTVVLSGWSKAGEKPSEAIRRRVDEVTGKALSFESLTEFLSFVSKNLPQESTGIQINAERDSDGRGLEVSLRVMNEPAHASWMDEGWAIGYTTRQLGPGGTKSSGSAFAEPEDLTTAFENIRAEFEKLLKGDHQSPFSLSLSIARLE